MAQTLMAHLPWLVRFSVMLKIYGPAGQARAGPLFLAEYAFRRVPFFSFQLILHFASDFIQSPTIIFMDAIINNARCLCHQ